MRIAGRCRRPSIPLNVRHAERWILLPARITEYLVVHEMAHLHEPHHTPEYWRRVERAMPDFGRREDWLAAHSGELEGLQSRGGLSTAWARAASIRALNQTDFSRIVVG